MNGKAILLNRQPTGGAGPCYVSVDQKGRDVLVANYSSGSVSVFPIDKEGALGPMSAFVQDRGSSVNPQRQEGPHAHCIVTDPDDRFAFACDLGLDKVMVFKFDPSKGSLVANDPPFASVKPGAGSRHIAFHPNRRYAYVSDEMASTVTAFAYDPNRGVLSEIEDYPLLPQDFKGQNTAAEVAVHPSGKFVYASNRGDDSIVVFACDRDTGKLTFIERDSTEGKTPRNFEIDPSGTFLLAANQDSGTIVVFRIDPKTGRLQSTGNKVATDLPMCVKCLGKLNNLF
jgi:6-phosphogluconolactonase